MALITKHLPFPRAARVLVSLALAALAAGCGLDPSLGTTADEAAPGPAAKGNPNSAATTTTTTTATATSADGTGRPLYTKTVSGTFSPGQAGSLSARFSNSYGDWSDVRVKEALFAVQAGSLGATQVITMSVTTGYVLEDLKVEFLPDGLTFSPSATLKLTFFWGSDEFRSAEQLAILQALAQHIHPEGTVTETATQIDRQGNAYLIVTIQVPGFSRYGLRG